MVAKAHLIAVAKEQQAESEPAVVDTLPQPVLSAPKESLRQSLSRTPRKLLALVIALALIAASGGFVWSYYFRHWSTTEIIKYVINDPTSDSPGFKHSLAGRTVTVEGTLTNITIMPTNVGILNVLELDDNPYIELMSWGGSFTIGQRVTMDVHFEWSECNLERHVYSPQIGFPGLQYLLAVGTVIDAISWVITSTFISWDNSADDVKIQVHWTDEPVSLAKVNVSVTAGRHSWTAEYIDTLGWYEQSTPEDSMASLTEGTSSGGMIQFTDVNGDSYLDDGDFFVISGLTRPSADSGLKSYIFSCQYPGLIRGGEYGCHLLAYLLMTNKGVVCHDYSLPSSPHGTPMAHMAESTEDGGYRFTVAKWFEGGHIPWSDTKVQFTDGSNYHKVDIESGDLLGTAPTTKSYPAFPLDDTTITCAVVDRAGNDMVDAGDSVTMTPSSSSLPEGDFFQMALIYSKTGEMICWSDIVIGSQACSNVTLTKSPEMVKLEFSEPMHNESDKYEYRPMDVSWDEIIVRMSDGFNSTSWSPPSAEDPGSIIASGRSLGSLNVSCTFHDLQANGLANRGDSLTLFLWSGGDFSPSIAYSVVLEYSVTGQPICEASFTG